MARARYLDDGDRRLNWIVERVKRDVAAPNQEYLLKYDDYLGLSNRKARTRERRLEELYAVCKLGACDDFKAMTREQAEEVVRRINRLKAEHADRLLSEYTRARIKIAFKGFIVWLTKDKELVDWIKPGARAHGKLPTELLQEEEVERMLRACTNQRDRTLLALLWDSGARIGEILNLRIKDVVMSGSSNYVMLNGKTGIRRTPLSVSVPFLAAYINQSRNGARGDEPLFTKLFEHGALDYQGVQMMLKNRARDAGIEKRVHAHLFRYSRVVFLHRNGMPAKALELFFGWSNLEMVDHYSKLSGSDVDNAFYKALGLKVSAEPEKPRLAARQCYKCHADNEPDARLCINCGTALDKSAFEQLDEMAQLRQKVNAGFEILMQSVDEETRAKIRKVFGGL